MRKAQLEETLSNPPETVDQLRIKAQSHGIAETSSMRRHQLEAAIKRVNKSHTYLGEDENNIYYLEKSEDKKLNPLGEPIPEINVPIIKPSPFKSTTPTLKSFATNAATLVKEKIKKNCRLDHIMCS